MNSIKNTFLPKKQGWDTKWSQKAVQKVKSRYQDF